jgi:prefoldin subunit 5
MEMNTQRRTVGLKEKIPDIQKTLDMVKFLKMRRDKDDDAEEEEGLLETNFELNDTLYARATISKQDTDEVYLWLGANVMLAYPIDEAQTMLTEKLRAAELSLSNCEEDLEFLREQITVFPLPFLRVKTNFCRPSKSRRPVCTTGTWCRGAKTRQREKGMTRTRGILLDRP